MQRFAHISRRLLSGIVLLNTIFIARASTSPSITPRITPLSHMRLSFELNEGQLDPNVRFLSRVGNYFLFLTAQGAGLVSNTTNRAAGDGFVGMVLLGSNEHVQISGIDPLEGRTNYFLGLDPQKWRTNIPNFAGVRYQDGYSKIDMDYHGDD